MSKQSTTTKASGGGGYSFADKVAAGFLAQMLKRRFPLEPDLGVIAELHFETRDIGHVLDDLMLVLKRGLDVTNCFVSVKSNRQITKEGFNKEFVQDAWNEWKGSSGSGFDRSKDILGLIVGQIDDPTLQEWQTLQKQASSTTPERLSARLRGDSKSSNKVQRAIFDGLRQSADGEMDAVETARLVARVRVLQFSDANEGDFVSLCAEIVRGGRVEDGAKLWARLVQLASENRATGGYFDLPKLIQVLRPDFDLQDHPDLRSDVSKLDAVSSQNIGGVRDVIGTTTRLARSDEKARLSLDIKAHDVIVVSGESGSGKSTMLSQLVGTGGAFKRTLWLTAEQLSKASQAELANALGLTRSIPELIRMATTHPAVLVVDGFERFEGEARKRAAELLRAVKEEGFVGWKVIVSCQPQSLSSAHDFLVEAGITDVHKFDFEKPALAEIREALESDSAMRPLLLRAELQPILRNLMVLDWVLRADVAQSLSTSDRVGVADVIDHIWERWTGTGNERLARDVLLRMLGEREGEKLSGAVQVDAIPANDLRLVEELGREGVLRVRPPSVQFSHDLIGDWARYRTLKFAGANATAMIKSVAKVPRWGRAIRLHAQSLAERGHGLSEWKTATVDLAGDDADSKLASDLFLDGLLFAVNSESLLEQVWSDIVANGGQILQRLLNRLLHVATFPDWRLMGIGDARTAEYTEARFRIPQPLFWIPVLRVLNRHSADVVDHALLQAAEVCALWLRTMPVGMFGRREAASLAIELAKEAQDRTAEGLHFGDKDKVVYEAMLSGAPEFPDEVAQIALELCGRKDEPAHAIKRRDEEQERQYRLQQEWRKKNPEKKRAKPSPAFVTSSHRDGPIRPPDPDGPTREVAEGFQAAVLDTQALVGLISVRPEIAREVLLAVCIEEPTPTDLYGDDRWMGLDLGLADWRQGYPPMYWKGGFLRFLQTAPKQGLDAIVRLVNYATARWLEGGLRREPTDADREKFGFDFQIEGKKVNWVGDCNVCAWHRQLPMDGDTIECALGALEKWLYDEIEKGNDVSEWLRFILEHSQSAAFAGLLISVGLKYHGLFAGQLQPLLGNYYVYQCQASLAQSEQGETWMISLARQPQEIVKLEAEWNRMPHRRWLLWDVASGIMLQHNGTAEFLAACRVEWEKLPEPSEKSRMEKQFFLARFDPANYSKTPHEDGGVLISMRWPDHLQAVVEASQNDRNLRQLALTLAPFARQLLEGQKSLPEDRLVEFVEQFRKLVEWKDSGDDALPEHYRISSIAGGLVVLVIEHREWLRKNPGTEAWCLGTLRDLKPVGSEHDSPHSITDHSAEIFLGEAGVALLTESSEEWVLRMAFGGVTGGHYNATLFSMWRAYLLRDQLGGRFDELVNVVVLWSALRRAAIRDGGGYYGNLSELPKYRETLFKRFVKGKMKGPVVSFRKAARLGSRLVERIERKTTSKADREQREAHRRWLKENKEDRKMHREMPDIDPTVIQKGFGFLYRMLRESAPDDEERLRSYVREVFDMEMRSLPRPEPNDDRSEISGTPYDTDRWVMARVAEFIARTNTVESARSFYRPILELGPSGKYWGEDFLESWFTDGLMVSEDLNGFGAIWQDMIAYTETLPAWQPNEGNYWSRAEGLAVHLMGLSEIGIKVLGEEKFKTLISSMAAAFGRWGSRWLKYGSAAGWFAYFLRTESGQVLLPQGVKQLAAVAESVPDDDWHRHGLGGLFTEVLSLCWKTRQQDIEKDPALRGAFLRLLTALCARQIPEALNLRNKVSELMSIA